MIQTRISCRRRRRALADEVSHVTHGRTTQNHPEKQLRRAYENTCVYCTCQREFTFCQNTCTGNSISPHGIMMIVLAHANPVREREREGVDMNTILSIIVCTYSHEHRRLTDGRRHQGAHAHHVSALCWITDACSGEVVCVCLSHRWVCNPPRVAPAIHMYRDMCTYLHRVCANRST